MLGVWLFECVGSFKFCVVCVSLFQLKFFSALRLLTFFSRYPLSKRKPLQKRRPLKKSRPLKKRHGCLLLLFHQVQVGSREVGARSHMVGPLQQKWKVEGEGEDHHGQAGEEGPGNL